MSLETLRSPTLREEVHLLSLESGLRVFFCPKPGFQKKYACYSTFYGSVDDAFRSEPLGAVRTVPAGIAHFLEHTLFETEEGNASDLFARNGAYSNAATSFSSTTYLFSSSRRFYENLGLLIDFVENPVFAPAKIEKERGIIEQEILHYEDEPGWVGYMGLLASLFAVHPMRVDIAGTVDSIRAIDSDLLHMCYRTFYHPANMILFVIGDLNGDEVFDFVRSRTRHVGAEAGGSGWQIERVYPTEPPDVSGRHFEAEMQVALPKLLIGYKEVDIPQMGPDLLHRELVSEFALDLLLGRGSEAFAELYEAQLALDDFSASYGACAGVGHVILGGETPDPAGLLQALERIVSGVCDGGLDTEAFRRAKRKFIGDFIRSFNSLEFIASNYTLYRFYDLDLFEAINTLEAIEQKDVERRIQDLFDPQRRALSLIRTPDGPGLEEMTKDTEPD